MAFFAIDEAGNIFPGVPGETTWSGSVASGFNVQPTNFNSSDEYYVFSAGNNTVSGLGGNDFLRAGNMGLGPVSGLDIFDGPSPPGFGGNGTNTLFGGDGNDFVALHGRGVANGDNGDDNLWAFNFGPNYKYDYTLNGGSGDDIVTGVSGATVVLNGGLGNDDLIVTGSLDGAPTDMRLQPQSIVLNGGADNDFLESEFAARMTGGTGADIFQLSRATASTRHVITDYRDGVDLIAFNQPFSSLSIRSSGTSTLIRNSSGTLLAELQNVSANSITGADFLRLNTLYFHT